MRRSLNRTPTTRARQNGNIRLMMVYVMTGGMAVMRRNVGAERFYSLLEIRTSTTLKLRNAMGRSDYEIKRRSRLIPTSMPTPFVTLFFAACIIYL